MYMSDGFYIPAGTQIGFPAQAASMDPELLDNPTVFDGFRFSRMRESIGAGDKWATSSLDHMAFGYGRHACPGRHFADLEIKQIMVHLLMNFDFKLGSEHDGHRPANIRAETQVVPNQQAHILMRERRT